ncbi:MAG: YggT family protein [Gemmatimonadaceae bacterium]|nr:YggT family protein [Gemmatimonadaceae bacterium]
MPSLLYALDTLINALRGGFLAFTVAVALLCLLDWMVRSRRLNPFGPFAGFLRTSIRPLMAPVERRVLRAGGHPATVPWWTLVLVVVAGIIVLEVLSFVRGQLAMAAGLVAGGARGVVQLAVAWTFELLRVALIVRVIASWVRASPFAWYVRWSYALTEWLLHPLRGVIPPFGPMDVTPIVAYLLLGLVQGFLMRLV